MPAGHKTRLPLQLGITFAGEVVIAGALVTAMPLLPLLLIVSFGAGVITLVAPALLLLVGYTSLRRAPMRRPSDILIDPRGLVVDGGSQHGLEIEWASVEPEQWQVLSEGRVKRLVVGGAGGALPLAETTSRSEQRSFELTVRTLREVTRAARGYAGERSAPRSPDVLSCRACGGAVAPDDADTVRCDYCGASVAMPPQLRARVRHAGEAQRARGAAARRIVTLLDQPSARATSRAIALLALPLVAAWIFSAWVTYRLSGANALRADSALGLLYFVAVSGAGCYFAARALADRRGTFALVAHQLSALAPPRPGAHHLCRACGAPLWEPPEAVVVICAHCETENILGFELRRDPHANDRFAIGDALARMSRQRVVSLALIGAAGLAAFVAVGVGRDALQGSLAAAGYVDDPSRLPPPAGPVYEAEVELPAPPVAGAAVETLRIPRIQMQSLLSERLQLHDRVWACAARELARGARGEGTLRVARWRKIGDSPSADVRTDVTTTGAFGATLSACVRDRAWRSTDVGVALFTLADRSIKRLKPPTTSIATTAFSDQLDRGLLSVEPSEAIAEEESGPKAMWRRYTVRANAKFLTAGVKNRCALGTTYAREAKQGCIVVEYAEGDTLVLTESFLVQLTERGWCGDDRLGGRCFCGGDTPCGATEVSLPPAPSR